MATLNTSNLTVPTVATMAQHLVESNPHPQYIRLGQLVSAVNTQISIGDLCDVIVSPGAPSSSVLLYDGFGQWRTVDIATLIGQITIPDATTSTYGKVRLATPAEAAIGVDSTAVITPYCLNVWQGDKGFIYSSSLDATLSTVYSNVSTNFPIRLQQLVNVNIENASSGYALVIDSWDNVAHTGTFVAKEIRPDKATSATFGVVRIATLDQVISGAGMTDAEMESSGYLVPSILSIKGLIGGDTFVSRVLTVNNTSTVYKNIVGTAGAGTTADGIVTVVNTNGYVIDHAVSGGVLEIFNGNAYNVVATGGMIAACPVTTAGSNVTPVTSLGSTAVTGKLYNAVVSTNCTAYIANGAEANAVKIKGYCDSTAATSRPTVVVGVNGVAHDVTVGETTTVASTMVQGKLLVSGGSVYNCTVNERGDAIVSSGALVTDISIIGTSANCTIENGGTISRCMAYSGASLVISSGAVADTVIAYSGTNLTVKAGGVLRGLVKLPGALVTIQAGATVVRADNRTSDIPIYSNATGSNINPSSIITFSSVQHPVGIRRAVVSSGVTTHTFYPMVATTRVPNATDPDFNDYTIDATGLDVWNDIYTMNTSTVWYVTF